MPHDEEVEEEIATLSSRRGLYTFTDHIEECLGCLFSFAEVYAAKNNNNYDFLKDPMCLIRLYTFRKMSYPVTVTTEFKRYRENRYTIHLPTSMLFKQ